MSIYVDKVLYEGRPESSDERLDKEMRVYQLLEELGVDYWRVDHEAAMTMDDCDEIDKVLGVPYCKNLFLTNAQESQFYLLLLPHHKKFKTAVLSKQIGSARLSFAKSEHMEQYLDITPGSVSIMGLMNDMNHEVQLLLDEEAFETDFVTCHPCINTASIKFKKEDLFSKILPHTGHVPIYVNL